MGVLLSLQEIIVVHSGALSVKQTGNTRVESGISGSRDAGISRKSVIMHHEIEVPKCKNLGITEFPSLLTFVWLPAVSYPLTGRFDHFDKSNFFWDQMTGSPHSSKLEML